MTGCFFVASSGGFRGLVKYDSSYLGLVIFILALAATFYMGKICGEIDDYIKDIKYKQIPNFKESILKKIGIVRYVAESCFDLGLLSTIIGLVMMFLGMGSDVLSLITTIKNALSTAFIPTLVGMIANLVLRLQMFIAEHAIED